jgi:hypothetical protein
MMVGRHDLLTFPAFSPSIGAISPAICSDTELTHLKSIVANLLTSLSTKETVWYGLRKLFGTDKK